MERILRMGAFVFDLARKRPKGWRSVIYNTAKAKARIPSSLMLPAHVSIEPTNACHARCPVCETGNGSMERRVGMLDPEKYRRLIDEIAPHTAVLMFYFMGEPFLHKHAYEMIRYAREKDIYVETCSAGDFVNPRDLIYSDVNQISFQIGGMVQETHEIYRIRSNLSRIRKNITDLVEERRKHPESNVQIEVGFIVMRHNEHEVAEFLSWAKEIGVDKANVVDPCVRDVEEGKKFLPEDKKYWFYDEIAFENGVLKPRKTLHNECTWVWNSVMINWDGSVVPCCRDPHGRHVMGNVFERPLREIWNSEAMVDFRRRIATDQANVDICKLCSGFGVPQLTRSRPIGFSVQRLTVDDTPLDLPPDILVEIADIEKPATTKRLHSRVAVFQVK